MKVRFWGVRGSIPTPLTPREVQNRALKLKRQRVRDSFLMLVRDCANLVTIW